MTEFFNNHSTYVLIGRDQYEVLLDDLENPTEMWSTIIFAEGQIVTIDGGRPPYEILGREIPSQNMPLRKYLLKATEY